MGAHTWWYDGLHEAVFQRHVQRHYYRLLLIDISESHPFPVVLFTHIPLYRPDGTYCGPLREKGTIRVGVGMGYQNTLGKHASQRLLETIQPSLIFRYVAKYFPEFALKQSVAETIMTTASIHMLLLLLMAFDKYEKSRSSLCLWR